MARAKSNGIEIEYELSGPADGPVLAMIHGVGAQLVRWPDAFCGKLTSTGFRILRLDNRDVGLSTHMDDAPVPDVAAVGEARRQGLEPALPYTLSDMASDVVGLFDAIGIDRAHLLGVSLGGMIAQVIAIEHPTRARSLNIFMSQSGNPELPQSRPEALAILSKRAPDPHQEREAYLRHQVELNRTVGSPAYPVPEAELRRYAALSADRAWNPLGPARQLAAGRGGADRRPFLRNLSLPAVVIHGMADPLLPVESAPDLAGALPGAWLLEIDGMGHDLPAALFDLFTGVVAANCARAN